MSLGTLYTIGYGKYRTGDALVAVLTDKARIVVDVRLVKYSGNRDFSLRTQDTLESRGLVYQWVPGLGNLRYKTGGIQIKRPEDTAIVGELLRKGDDVALLCVCPSPKDCHRSTVATMLKEQIAGLAVIDL